MQTIVRIPESYRDYATDRTIQSVVNHLLEQQDKDLPSELEWNEVRAYHQAWLSAQKVKTDYIFLLMDLWDLIWKSALNNHEINLDQSWSIEDMQEKDAEPSQHVLWNDKRYYRWFSCLIGDHGFLLETLIIIEDENIRIGLEISDKDDESITNKLEFSDLWGRVGNEHHFSTKNKLVTMQKNTDSLDISHLVTLADQAMTSFIEYTQT